MKKIVRVAFGSIETSIASVIGTAAIATGICTATAHNIVLGLMILAVGYACYKEDKE